MNTTFDTYAWIEYFVGSEKGRKARKHVESSETIFTPTLALMELKTKYLKEKAEYQTRIEFIRGRSKIVPLGEDIALLAAEIKTKRGLHASDAIVYATAKATQSKLLTGDAHFFGFEGVELL